MISDFFAKICCKHLTKRLNFATILVACGRGSFFCAPFLRKISFAILCRACVFPRSFTQSKLPSGKPRAPRLARNFSAKAKEEDFRRNPMSRLRFPSVIYESKLPSGKPRAPRLARNFSAKAKEEDFLRNIMSRLLHLIDTARPQDKLCFSSPYFTV